MVKDGSDIFLAVSGAVINGQTTGEITLTVDEIEITTKDSGSTKEFMAGDDSETMSVEIMFDETDTVTYAELKAYAKAKTNITFMMGEGIKTTGKEIEHGSGFITSLGKSAPQNSAVVCQCSIRITGGTTLVTSTTTLA